MRLSILIMCSNHIPYTDMFRRRCLPITAVDAQSAPHFNVRVCSMTPEPLGRPES
jgi:hypothetical protein